MTIWAIRKRGVPKKPGERFSFQGKAVVAKNWLKVQMGNVKSVGVTVGGCASARRTLRRIEVDRHCGWLSFFVAVGSGGRLIAGREAISLSIFMLGPGNLYSGLRWLIFSCAAHADTPVDALRHNDELLELTVTASGAVNTRNSKG